MSHFQLRLRHDRQAKKARCACGWEGPWRTTPSTGRRWADALARANLARADYLAHVQGNFDGFPSKLTR